MGSRWRRMIAAVQPQGIPWPASLVYNAVSKSRIFQQHYELAAEDICACFSGGRLLDVGTGPGWLLVEICRRCPEGRLLGLDISAGMVAQARQNVRKAGCADAVELCEGTVEELPFPDDSFDMVVSTGSLHHWPDFGRALNEIHRVLEPGGRAFLYDLVMHMPEDARRDVVRRFGRFRMALLAWHSLEEAFYDAEEMESLAARSRFGSGRTSFVGALCRLALAKESG